MKPEEREIRALVRLLSEETEGHVVIVHKRLLEYGELAVPYLREALERSPDSTSSPAAKVLEEIRLTRLEKEICAYAREAAPDLEEGLFLLARFKHPEATQKAYGPVLERMAAGLRRRISDSVEHREVVAAVRRYFYGEEGFCGNRWDYYDPDNSFIHRVLERKTGIPISLAAAILLVARRIGLRFYGVGMPGHFLLQYGSGKEGILIDPFNGGEVLEREAIRESFESRGLEFRDSYLAPTGTREILARTLRNLIAIYRQRGETEGVARLNRFHRIVLQGSSST